MKCLDYVAPALVLALAVATSPASRALGRLAEISIIDRETGAALTPVYCRGEYWVAGSPGSRYAIEIRNRLGERVLAVASVDGVNVVTGATAAWDQSGYVFAPQQQYEITGWRKSDSAVAAFTFTDSSRSYAQLTGRPGSIGVIGIALFREARQPPTLSLGENAPMAEGTPSARQSAPAASGESAAKSAPSAQDSASARAEIAPPAAAAKLGTGHGEREYSYVSRTDFARMQAQPNEIIRIRYDSLENLFAMGIVKRPRPAAPWANPFPGSPIPQFVPDPPG